MPYDPNRPEEQIEDWTILYGGDCAVHNARGGDAEVELDQERGLYVRLEEGSGLHGSELLSSDSARRPT